MQIPLQGQCMFLSMLHGNVVSSTQQLMVRSNAVTQVQQGNGAGDAQAADAPLPTGRLLVYADITPALKGRQAEVTTANPAVLLL